MLHTGIFRETNIFRGKSAGVSKKKARDPLIEVFLESPNASVYLCHVW